MGEAVVYEEFSPGLESLDSFTHAILIYWFHRSTGPRLLLTPYLDSRERGVFSTRAPSRPNPIGLSVIEIKEVRPDRVLFKGADMLNNTPLLDIKPFVPEFDNRPEASSGWLEKPLHDSSQSFAADDRFQA
jgi:tRNA-Thr(GGU) m(6)t(6)A37 methyltransferase TsaA